MPINLWLRSWRIVYPTESINLRCYEAIILQRGSDIPRDKFITLKVNFRWTRWSRHTEFAVLASPGRISLLNKDILYTGG